MHRNNIELAHIGLGFVLTLVVFRSLGLQLLVVRVPGLDFSHTFGERAAEILRTFAVLRLAHMVLRLGVGRAGVQFGRASGSGAGIDEHEMVGHEPVAEHGLLLMVG